MIKRTEKRALGAEGLLARVIELAARDAVKGRGENRASAWAYFASETYRHDLNLLGLPADMLPAAIEELVDER